MIKLPSGVQKFISVNRVAAKQRKPACQVLCEGVLVTGQELFWTGPSRMVSRPDKPLTPTGPAIWIETDAEVTVQ